MIDQSVKAISPKARQWAAEHQRVAGTGQDIDYVRAPRPTLAPKDARFEAAWRANAVPEIQVAPLK